MGAAYNETRSVRLYVSGYCLKSVCSIAIITSLHVRCVGHTEFRVQSCHLSGFMYMYSSISHGSLLVQLIKTFCI